MNNALKFELKKVLHLIVLSLLCTLSAYAQVHKENALLWEVSGPGMQEPSYIFGIVKFIPDSDYFMPKEVLSRLNKSKTLSTETLLDHHAKHELNKAAHLPHHESLDKYLTDEEFEKLKSIFHDQLGVSQLKFNLVYKKFKPVMLSTTMTRLALNENVTYYEFELIKKANEAGIITVGLETVEREVEALEKFELSDQVDALKHSIANFDQQLEDYKHLISAYKRGDLHSTLEYTMHPVENTEDFKQHFVFDRNEEWLPKMISYMKEAPTFFAIGTSHLADENGILHLLTESGYTVKPVKLNQ